MERNATVKCFPIDTDTATNTVAVAHGHRHTYTDTDTNEDADAYGKSTFMTGCLSIGLIFHGVWGPKLSLPLPLTLPRSLPLLLPLEWHINYCINTCHGHRADGEGREQRARIGSGRVASIRAEANKCS